MVVSIAEKCYIYIYLSTDTINITSWTILPHIIMISEIWKIISISPSYWIIIKLTKICRHPNFILTCNLFPIKIVIPSVSVRINHRLISIAGYNITKRLTGFCYWIIITIQFPVKCNRICYLVIPYKTYTVTCFIVCFSCIRSTWIEIHTNLYTVSKCSLYILLKFPVFI